MLYSCTCVAILGVIGLSTLGVAYTYLFSSKTEFDSASYLCGYARLEPPLLIHPSGLIVWYGYPSPCSNNTHTESIFPSRRWFDISNACSWLNLEIGRGSPKHLRNRKKSRYGKNTEKVERISNITAIALIRLIVWFVSCSSSADPECVRMWTTKVCHWSIQWYFSYENNS